MNAVSLKQDVRYEAPKPAAPSARASFSRPSHFAMVLVPMALGVVYSLFRDYWFAQHATSQGITDSIRLSLHYGRTAWLSVGVFGLWAFGVGSALTLLKGISQLEDREPGRK